MKAKILFKKFTKNRINALVNDKIQRFHDIVVLLLGIGLAMMAGGMNMSFEYSLRYTLDPRTNTPQKDDLLLKFCEEGRVDNVAFFINPEELNHSHLTAAQTQVWLDAIRPLSERLAKVGISTSLNPWTTIMHSDRGQVVNPEIGFSTLVDVNGHQAHSMACPGDQVWRDYLSARYAQYATLHPKELWLEDDFRHYNHSPLKLACFCPRHMRLYAEKLGRDVTRAEFVKEMLQPGEPTPARKAYLDVAREEMKVTVHQIEQAVHAVSPETNLAQMTSFPDWHAMEGRDWDGLFDNLRGAGHPRVARPHLPAYNEVAPLKYGRIFEDYTRTTAAYLGDDAQLWPELESYMYSPFVKSRKFTQMQIETAALVGAKGILLNLFDMIGNGIDESYGYAKMLADSKDFLNRISEQRLQMQKLRGIRVLVSQDSAYTLHTAKGAVPEELLPKETSWAALLSQFGMATTITPWHQDSVYQGEQLAVSGQFLRNLSNEQVEQLLTDNTVLLDGDSVAVIVERNLGRLLHIENAQWRPVRTGYQTYEAADGHTAEGVVAPRITMLQHVGDYYQIKYNAGSDVDVWSHAYNEVHEQLGNVMSIIDGHIIVLPLGSDPKYGWEAEYVGFRQALLQQALDTVGASDYLCGMPNVKLNVLADDARTTLWLANFTLDDYEQIVWHPSKSVAAGSARLIIRRGANSIEQTVALQHDGADIRIAHPLRALETVQLIIE
jgi:hypothetical protein